MRSSARFAAWLGVGIALLAGCSDSPATSGGDSGSTDAAASIQPHDAGTDAPAPIACTVTAPTECSDPDIRYADVKPILVRRCLSCHDGTSPQWPLTSYTHVADWVAPIRAMMLNCSMPPPDSGMTMPIEEREALLLWIRCGYPR